MSKLHPCKRPRLDPGPLISSSTALRSIEPSEVLRHAPGITDPGVNAPSIDAQPSEAGSPTGNHLTELSPQGAGFAWTVCAGDEIHQRVFIKQQAVDDALMHALKISADLAAAKSRNPWSEEVISWVSEVGKSIP